MISTAGNDVGGEDKPEAFIIICIMRNLLEYSISVSRSPWTWLVTTGFKPAIFILLTCGSILEVTETRFWISSFQETSAGAMRLPISNVAIPMANDMLIT